MDVLLAKRRNIQTGLNGNKSCASVNGRKKKKRSGRAQRGEEKENSTKVISAASLSHICSSGKQKQRGGESECVYVGM